MTKNAGNLDERDRRIVARLRENGRTSISALARELNLSRTATVARVSKLAREGVLNGYTARVRPGPDVAVMVWFFVKLEAGCKCSSLADILSSRPELLQCHALAGEWDLLIQAGTSGPQSTSDLRDWLADLPGVVTVNTQAVLATHFDR